MKTKGKWKVFAFSHFFYHDECSKPASDLYDELMLDPKGFLASNDDVVTWAPFENWEMLDIAEAVDNLAACAQKTEELK